MENVKINSVAYSFMGLFQYEDKYLKLAKTNYEPLDLYIKNKDYFNQKYYSNWIDSFFQAENSTSRHLKLKANNPLLNESFQLLDSQENTKVNYKIKAIDIFFFKANLGIFVIKIDLPEIDKISYNEIANFGLNFRQTTINEKQLSTPKSVELIEKHIISCFHPDKQNWRKYNPQLKSALFIDINKTLQKNNLDELLYKLGTFSTIKNEDNLNAPEETYFKRLLDKGSISVFKNWKALCLYDSITRISVNLNEKDKYKLWENEYILIYIYVLYARYFLHYTNNQLIKVFDKPKLVEAQRNSFFEFKNEFNHTKISYKFLPNEIYSRLKDSLGIEEELDSINEKLNRTSVIRQEKHQKRVNRILFGLTLLTLISVAHDAGQMLFKWVGYSSLIISTIIIGVCIILIGLSYFKKK